MDPNDKLFESKLEFPRSGVEREEQDIAIKKIVLGWSDQSKYNQRRSE